MNAVISEWSYTLLKLFIVFAIACSLVACGTLILPTYRNNNGDQAWQ